MKRLILLITILTHAFANFSYSQNLGEEYADLKVCYSIRKALKYRSEPIILNLKNKGLISLPENIGELQNMKVLNLAGNRIKDFPESLWQLKQLEVLIISDNGLDSLPKKIDSLNGLKKLYVSRNYLSSIPVEITNLKNLKTLDLSFNKLVDSDADFIRRALPDCFVLVYVKL